MPLFDYRAKDIEGANIKGAVEAKDQDEAHKILEENNLTPFDVRIHKKSVLSFNIHIGRRVPIKDLVVFSRQLSVMVAATLPLVQSLKIIVKQTTNKVLKEIIAEVAEEIEGGAKLSLALSKYPDVFDDFFVNLIRSGETSGRLSEVLVYLADQIEKDYDLSSKIKGAMIYPAFILTGLIVVGTVMMIFVVPKLTDVLKESGGELPVTTKILIAVSGFMVSYWWLLLIIVVGTVVGFRYYVKTPSGRFVWDSVLLRLPIFGPLFQKIYLVRFTRSLETLIVGKVPLTQGLRVVADVVGNSVYKDLIVRTVKEVEDGNSISTVFLQSHVVPSMISQMMVVGEQTGRLEEVLQKLTNFYGREIDNTVANLVTLIEPIVMIVMGVAVGGMVAAIILPTYNLASSI